MSRRKLSKQQSERIKKSQRDKFAIAQESNVENAGLRGQIVSHHGKKVDVEYCDEQQQRQIISCHFRANLEAVVTGDWVLWQREGEAGVVVSLQERESVLLRPDAFGQLKPVAANVSRLVLVIAPEPEAHSGLIDRYLVATENMGAKALILINKSDLLNDTNNTTLADITATYQNIGYTVLQVSAHTGAGLENLKTHLLDETSVFVGQSGVGKSSLIQKLLPEEELRVGDLSSNQSKGRHTTTHSQLYHFSSGGVCIDSPGIREFGLWHMTPDEVLQGFVDLRAQALNCKFRNCTHETEPKCGIHNAIEKGLLYKTRFDSYKHILNTLNEVNIKKGRPR